MAYLEFELQKAVFALLSGDAPLTALISAVYDDVPQGDAVFPYVTIGEAVHSEFDTDTELGFDVSITIHAWSRHTGRSQTKQIQGAIYRALHRANFSVSGYNLITCDFNESQTFVDTDGITRHGTQTFRLLLEEV